MTQLAHTGENYSGPYARAEEEEPRKETPVLRELERLARAQAGLAQSADALDERLTHVLVPVGEERSRPQLEEVTGTPADPVSPVVAALRMHVARLDRLQQRLDALAARVE